MHHHCVAFPYIYYQCELKSKFFPYRWYNLNCICRYAITLGSTTDYEGPSLKIENGFKFRVSVAFRYCCYCLLTKLCELVNWIFSMQCQHIC